MSLLRISAKLDSVVRTFSAASNPRYELAKFYSLRRQAIAKQNIVV